MNILRKILFDFIRRTFWRDYNHNEDFDCGMCGKEMLGRYLFCSTKCSAKFDAQMYEQTRNIKAMPKEKLDLIRELVKDVVI